MCIKVSILGSEFVLELQYHSLHLKDINIEYDIRYDVKYDIGFKSGTTSDMISDMMSCMISYCTTYNIIVYLLTVLILDLTIIIQVFRSCSTDGTSHGFGVAVWVRDISSIQLTVRTSAHRALVDITQ